MSAYSGLHEGRDARVSALTHTGRGEVSIAPGALPQPARSYVTARRCPSPGQMIDPVSSPGRVVARFDYATACPPPPPSLCGGDDCMCSCCTAASGCLDASEGMFTSGDGASCSQAECAQRFYQCPDPASLGAADSNTATILDVTPCVYPPPPPPSLTSPPPPPPPPPSPLMPLTPPPQSPIPAFPPSAKEVMPMWAQVVLVGSVGLLLLCAIFIWYIRQRSRSRWAVRSTSAVALGDFLQQWQLGPRQYAGAVVSASSRVSPPPQQHWKLQRPQPQLELVTIALPLSHLALDRQLGGDPLGDGSLQLGGDPVGMIAAAPAPPSMHPRPQEGLLPPEAPPELQGGSGAPSASDAHAVLAATSASDATDTRPTPAAAVGLQAAVLGAATAGAAALFAMPVGAPSTAPPGAPCSAQLPVAATALGAQSSVAAQHASQAASSSATTVDDVREAALLASLQAATRLPDATFTHLLELLPLAVFVKDAVGDMLFANKAGAKGL